MSIGTLIFMGEGIVAYKNKFLLEALSPIMQSTRRAKVCGLHCNLIFLRNDCEFYNRLEVFIKQCK